MKLPRQKKPCANCPFRKDSIKGWLGEERMRSILNNNSFVCHKNTDLQCAGHILILDNKNAFVKFAGRLNIDLNMQGRELVFDTAEDCIKHHTIKSPCTIK